MRTEYNSNNFSDYTEICSDSGLVYLCSVSNNSKINVTVDDVKNIFRAY